MNIKKSTRTTMTVILAIILLGMTVYTGCNSGSNAVTSAGTATPVPPPENTPQPTNLGTFTVVMPDNGSYQTGAENETIKKAIIEKLARDRGVIVDMNMVPLPYDDYFNAINNFAGSGQPIDCIIDKYSTFNVYKGVQGLCVPLDDLLLQDGKNLLEKIDQSRWQKVTANNNILAIPNMAMVEETCLYARKDTLDMMGIPVPKTRENFIGTLFALSTLIPSGITPLAINWNQSLDYMTYLHHVPANDFVNEGKGFFMREQDEFFIDFMDMMKRFYTKGYIPKDFFDLTDNDVTTLFTSGLAMMYVSEYTDVASDYKKLLSTTPTAEVALVSNPSYRRMEEPILSAEEPISQICVFASYGKNHKAAMTYYDWMLSDVERYETTKLGVMGTHINFNNIAHECEYLGDFAVGATPYNKLYGFGMENHALYAPVAPLNGDVTDMKCKKLQKTSYDLLSSAKIKDEGRYALSENAQGALYYYRTEIDEAVKRYIKGEIDASKFRQYLHKNQGNIDIIVGELNANYGAK
jgi:ABC-type glycerol-3-phosphate transport system substrate-binding protein